MCCFLTNYKFVICIFQMLRKSLSLAVAVYLNTSVYKLGVGSACKQYKFSEYTTIQEILHIQLYFSYIALTP